MRRIWKYYVPLEDQFTVEMPEGADVLCVQEQHRAFYMWALVTPTAAKVSRTFYVLGTGHPVPEDAGRYISTFQPLGGRLVFHLFEKG